MTLYPLIRPLLFSLDPEAAHHLAQNAGKCASAIPGALSIISACYRVDNPKLETTVMGLRFPNPVGLAAGFDKNAENINFLSALGFGFLEVGTVTPRAQPGNDRPRLFRIPEAEAIINRMGFNNNGADALVKNVLRSTARGPLGINIGKNLDTALEDAVSDYCSCHQKVFPHADYIAVNVSSPNTPGLRKLQHADELAKLLSALRQQHDQLEQELQKRVPLALKIAPDLESNDIADIAKVVEEFSIDGVIATNTTIAREYVKGLNNAEEAGGLSGRPLTEISTIIIRELRSALPSEIPIIGVGGIADPSDAIEKLEAGASLVQVYSGLIYEGPALCKQINRGLLKEMSLQNYSSVNDFSKTNKLNSTNPQTSGVA